MISIILNGALGRMGSVVKEAAAVKGVTVAAMADRGAVDGSGIYSDIRECRETADVIIDFSHHTSARAVTAFAAEKHIPCVIATTGQTPEELSVISEAAERVPIFISANMSLGIALLADMAARAAALLPDADIEIIEKHHNRKLDAPSGTALMLASAISAVRPDSEPVFGRSGQGKRRPCEIGIHSLRMGNVIGEHEVIIASDTQTISLCHEAHSRELFADGALAAAEYIMKKPAGLYTMQNLITDGGK